MPSASPGPQTAPVTAAVASIELPSGELSSVGSPVPQPGSPGEDNAAAESLA